MDGAAGPSNRSEHLPSKVALSETLASIVRATHFPAKLQYAVVDAPPAAAAGGQQRSGTPSADRVALWAQQQHLGDRLATPRHCRATGVAPSSRKAARFHRGAGALTARQNDSKGYSNFEDLLGGDWSHPRELRPPAPCGPPTPGGQPPWISGEGLLHLPTGADAVPGSERLSGSRPTSSNGRAPGAQVAFKSVSRPSSASDSAALADGATSKKAQASELSSMLRELNMDMAAVTMPTEWASILRLAEGNSGLDPKLFDPGYTDTTSDETPGPAVKLDAGDGVSEMVPSESPRSRSVAKQSRPRKKSLTPGVYYGIDDRAPFRPTSVRGLPERGKRADLCQAKAKSVEVRWRKNDTKAWSQQFEGFSILPDGRAGPMSLLKVPNEAAAKKGQPIWFSSEIQEEDQYHVELENERKAQLEWKRKVADCAKNLAMEAHRFRLSDD